MELSPHGSWFHTQAQFYSALHQWFARLTCRALSPVFPEDAKHEQCGQAQIPGKPGRRATGTSKRARVTAACSFLSESKQRETTLIGFLLMGWQATSTPDAKRLLTSYYARPDAASRSTRTQSACKCGLETPRNLGELGTGSSLPTVHAGGEGYRPGEANCILSRPWDACFSWGDLCRAGVGPA